MESTTESKVYVGCAGWSLPKTRQAEFPSDGSHLARYAGRFNAVEINSSFYRPHQSKTYARWAASVPDTFRFSIKVPKAITHTARLKTSVDVVRKFVEEVAGLGERLGCWLVQLPPSLQFDPAVAAEFFELFLEEAASSGGSLVCEPRHTSWFTPAADALLEQYGIARVAADPAIVPAAARSGGAREPVYIRLHGSPRMYYSAYSQAQIQQSALWLEQCRGEARQAWCIFDNTADGAAIDNGLQLLRELGSGARRLCH